MTAGSAVPPLRMEGWNAFDDVAAPAAIRPGRRGPRVAGGRDRRGPGAGAAGAGDFRPRVHPGGRCLAPSRRNGAGGLRRQFVAADGRGVAAGSLIGGVGCAWLASMCRFPGRGFFEWALLLPMAMPAYIIAYTYTSMLDFAGPVQTLLREATGWGFGDYWFPEIRSLGGAVVMLSMVLYPYVYLLTRAAFLNQSLCVLDVSRTLGNGPWRTFFTVALPLARPAIVAGLSLAMMETLADYGTVKHFGVQTFTTGIFRTWYGLDNAARRRPAFGDPDGVRDGADRAGAAVAAPGAVPPYQPPSSGYPPHPADRLEGGRGVRVLLCRRAVRLPAAGGATGVVELPGGRIAVGRRVRRSGVEQRAARGAGGPDRDASGPVPGLRAAAAPYPRRPRGGYGWRAWATPCREP